MYEKATTGRPVIIDLKGHMPLRNLYILTFFIFISLGYSPCVEAGTYTVQFEQINGFIVLEAEVDGVTGTYVFDTGAPGLILNASHSYTGQITLTELLGVNGPYTAEVMPVSKFVVAGRKFRHVEAFLLPLGFLERAIGKSVDGLFGLDLLKGLEIMLDMQNAELSMSKRKGRLSLDKDAIFVHMDNAQHLPTVEFGIGERTYRFGLDTGSKSNLICKSVANDIPGFRVNVEDHVALSSADQRIRIVPLVAIDIQEARTDVMSSSHYLNFLLTDMGALAYNADISIDGILGTEFISGKVILIDKKRQTMGISGNLEDCNSLALR